MTVVAYGVDHGVDRLLNMVRRDGIRILMLTHTLKDPLKPVLVRLWRCFSLFERCLWIVLRCFSIVRVLFCHCCGVDRGRLWSRMALTMALDAY
jgi:hypothetical protein